MSILAAALVILAVAVGPAPLVLAALYGARWLRRALTPPVVVVEVPVPKFVEIPLFVRVPVIVNGTVEPAPAAGASTPPPQALPEAKSARPVMPERGDLVDIQGTKFYGLVVCYDGGPTVWCRIVKSASRIDGNQVATCDEKVYPWPMSRLKIIDRGTPVIGALN